MMIFLVLIENSCKSAYTPTKIAQKHPKLLQIISYTFKKNNATDCIPQKKHYLCPTNIENLEHLENLENLEDLDGLELLARQCCSLGAKNVWLLVVNEIICIFAD